MLILKRNIHETWRECVIRIASKQGLQSECLVMYEIYLHDGSGEAEAAWSALYEWDCVPFESSFEQVMFE